MDSNDSFRKLSYAQILEHKPGGKQIATASITGADGLINASKPPSENGLEITPLPHEDTSLGPDVSLEEKRSSASSSEQTGKLPNVRVTTGEDDLEAQALVELARRCLGLRLRNFITLIIGLVSIIGVAVGIGVGVT